MSRNVATGYFIFFPAELKMIAFSPITSSRLLLRRFLPNHCRNGRRGCIGRKGMFIHNRNVLTDQLLNVFQRISLIGAAKGKSYTGIAGPAGPPDTVHIGFGHIGQFEIDHV